MKKKAVLVSYIYPVAKKYLRSFVDSLNKQNCNDFDVILFNDGATISEDDLEELSPSFQIIDSKHKSIPNIRFDSFHFLTDQGYEYVIFQDIDDGMSTNRVEQTISGLTLDPIVCNDLSISKDGKIIAANVWSHRMEHGFNFDQDFLADKNIIGLGNSGVRSEVLKTKIIRDNNIWATDWFVFYQFLNNGKLKGSFLHDCTTIYNQHEQNTAGLSNELTFESIYKATMVKKRHYSALVKFYPNLNKELERLDAFEKTLENYKNKNIKLNKFPFWWEETEMI